MLSSRKVKKKKFLKRDIQIKNSNLISFIFIIFLRFFFLILFSEELKEHLFGISLYILRE